MAPKRVIVLGARGVFGSLLVRELSSRYDVVPAGRGTRLQNAFAVACTAGPFQQLDRRLAREAVEAGAHWLDIADDERWFFDLIDDRSLDAFARSRGVAVIPGLSSLPAVSGALVRRLSGAAGFSPPKEAGGLKPAAPQVQITLRINNRNAKGAAAIASAAASGGRVLKSPDRELLRRELGIDAEAHVEFESSLAIPMLRLLGRWPRFAAKLARPFRFGTSGGAVEVRAGDRVEKITSKDQRIAILPLVFALQRLEGLSGCLTPSVFDAETLLAFLHEAA
ncbi:MAG TPA: hypothetical protein VKB93_14370 [Thermoanaerobaculia bacterium]|nr:hypothetical protein [Thermoanaerobaculia bacterium]